MRIDLFGVGLQGKSPKATAQKRQNCYYEFQPDGEHTRVVIYGTPGLELFYDFGDTPIRGMHSFVGNSRLYVVHRGTFWELTNAGVATNRGTLNTTSGRVSMVDNGTQICIVDGTDGWIFNTSSNTFTRITDAQFPSSPTTVTFHNARFLVSKGSTGEFYASDAYDGLAWTALMFATAESSPDNLVRIDARDEVILWGEFTTEFWADTGSAGFPYARIPGTNLQWGLASRWSVAPFLDSFAFLAKNSMGEVTVVYLNGYQPERISNFELEHTINNYSTVNDATGFSYMLGGHPMYQLNFPSAGYSWLYDASTKLWSQLKSANVSRHRGEIRAQLVNKNYVSDYTNGKLYRLNSSVYTDNGDAIELELISRHIVDDDRNVAHYVLELLMEAGVGLATGQGSNPQAMLQVSRDGGNTYGVERWAGFGALGKYETRARFKRLGKARDCVYKVRITDPVKRVITGANLVAA